MNIYRGRLCVQVQPHGNSGGKPPRPVARSWEAQVRLFLTAREEVTQVETGTKPENLKNGFSFLKGTVRFRRRGTCLTSVSNARSREPWSLNAHEYLQGQDPLIKPSSDLLQRNCSFAKTIIWKRCKYIYSPCSTLTL